MLKIKNQNDITLYNHVMKFSTEIECLSRNPIERVGANLTNSFGRFATNGAVNDGNGFNQDLHRDSSVPNGRSHNNLNSGIDRVPNPIRTYDSMEISTSPLNGTSFKEMVAELTILFDKLKSATGGMYPTCYGSNHIHCSIAYDRDGNLVEGINSVQLINYVATVIKGFFPAIRILGAFTPSHIVRKHMRWGNDYSYTDLDDIWRWSHNSRDFSGSRGSILRTEYSNYANHSNTFHVEYRGSDSCQSPVLIALQMSVVKAIVLYCINCIKHGTKPYVTEQMFDTANRLTAQLGANILNKDGIKEMGNELISRLKPYFKTMNSPELADVLGRFYTKPAIEILREVGKADAWEVVEKWLMGRTRVKDETKRIEFLKMVVSGAVPRGKDLNEHKAKIAEKMNIPLKEVNSLYVMLNREGHNLVFDSGRLCVL